MNLPYRLAVRSQRTMLSWQTQESAFFWIRFQHCIRVSLIILRINTETLAYSRFLKPLDNLNL